MIDGSLCNKGVKKEAMETEEGYGTRELKTRFALSQDSFLKHDVDHDVIEGDGKVDHESDKPKTAVKERTLRLEM